MDPLKTKVESNELVITTSEVGSWKFPITREGRILTILTYCKNYYFLTGCANH